MDPLEFLSTLQSEAEPSGFHKGLRAWVGDNSSVARVLTEMKEREELLFSKAWSLL